MEGDLELIGPLSMPEVDETPVAVELAGKGPSVPVTEVVDSLKLVSLPEAGPVMEVCIIELLFLAVDAKTSVEDVKVIISVPDSVLGPPVTELVEVDWLGGMVWPPGPPLPEVAVVEVSLVEGPFEVERSVEVYSDGGQLSVMKRAGNP